MSMSYIRWGLASCLSATVLTGCANIAHVTGAPPATTVKAPQATSFTAEETMQEAGLAHPQTVWAPFFYTKNGDALFIRGKRFRVSGAGSNVPGFIDAPYGYLVVVQSRPNTSLIEGHTILHGPQYLFYEVNHAGKKIRWVGSLPYRKHSQVVVAHKAIYISYTRGNIGGYPLYHFSGYSAAGKHVDGPQGVLYAAPTASGQWDESRVVDTHRFMLNCAPEKNSYALVYDWGTEANGQFKKLRQSNVCYGQTQVFINPEGSVVVNRPNYASSVRTGYFLRVFSTHPALTQHIDWSLQTVNPTTKPVKVCWGLIGRKCVEDTSSYSVTVGSSNTNMSLPVAGGMAVGSYLFRDKDSHPAWATQISLKAGFMSRSLSYGYVSMLPKHHTTDHPIFPIMSTALNTFRNFFTIGAGNDSVYDAQGEYPAINISTPGHFIMIPAGTSQGSGHAVGYDVKTGKKIPFGEVLSFLTSYGIQP